jgi:hypothetical protein
MTPAPIVATSSPTIGDIQVTTELKQQLMALHTKLENTRSVDLQTHELLVVLLGDITRLLGQPKSEDEQRTLTERLDELAVKFEAEHPALGTAIRQVVDALAKAGI